MKKIALITGAARRIGRHMALHLVDQGYDVALHYDQSAREAKKLQAEIKQRSKVSCEILKADLADVYQVQQLWQKANAALGGITLLVNNASIFKSSTLAAGDVVDLEQHWMINLKAPYVLMAQMAQTGKSGNIVNVLDTHIRQQRSAQANYLLAKKSLADLTQMAAREWAPRLRVNGIAPGLILAPAEKPAGYLDRLARTIPMQRKGKVTYVLQALDYLLTNDYVTGQIMYVDGGEHLLP